MSTSEAVGNADIRRLEDRIEAVNREGQLRLDAAMARIEGQITTLANDVRDIKGNQRTQFQWLAGLILAVGLGLGALFVGVKQVWVGGVQVGQTMQVR